VDGGKKGVGVSTAAGQITKDLRALLPSWITEVRFREAIDVNGRFVLFLFMGQCQHSGFRAVTLDTAADDTAGDVPMPAQRLQSCDRATSRHYLLTLLLLFQ
jgi:hypothetical protein